VYYKLLKDVDSAVKDQVKGRRTDVSDSLTHKLYLLSPEEEWPFFRDAMEFSLRRRHHALINQRLAREVRVLAFHLS
jgi:hypothetical protein